MTALFSKTAKQKNGEPVRHKGPPAAPNEYSVRPLKLARAVYVGAAALDT